METRARAATAGATEGPAAAPDIAGTFVLGVLRDEDDVERIARYRLVN